MKKGLIIAVSLALIFLGPAMLPGTVLVEQAYAQGISGDGLCGGSVATKCTPEHFKALANKMFLLFASVGTAILFLFIIYRIVHSVYLYMANNDPSALAKARTQSFNMLIGYVIIIAVFGGFYVVALKAFGVNENFLRLLEKFFSEGFVEHAYASNHTLPNPTRAENAYDIIVSAINLSMKFFIYPSLIAMWVASGFKFVYSQGNPDGLKTARSWLLVSFIVTIIAFTLQGFILAFRGTAEKVFQGASQNTSGTSDGRGAPPAVQGVTSCTGQPANKVCVLPGGRTGLCGNSEEGVWGCYVGQCYGQVGTDGICYQRSY